jgi:(p)ppGpp synthase/HD superfamily hydrolase
MKTMTQDYSKLKPVITTYLMTKKYFKALRAMNFAQQYHKGTRKDGDPEFSHQVSQACLAMTLEPFFLFPEETFCVIFLHDVCEDYDVPFSEIEKLFGEKVGHSVKLMSKESVEWEGKLPNEFYYSQMGSDEIASVAKGFDRIHNLMTMLGGFKPTKRVQYIQETLDVVVPMLKKARKNFPEQNLAYENIKFILTNQVRLYQELDKAIS